MIVVIDLQDDALFRVTDNGGDQDGEYASMRAQRGEDILDITMTRGQAGALYEALASYLNRPTR